MKPTRRAAYDSSRVETPALNKVRYILMQAQRKREENLAPSSAYTLRLESAWLSAMHAPRHMKNGKGKICRSCYEQSSLASLEAEIRRHPP